MTNDATMPAGRTRQVSPARMAKYRTERDTIMRAAYRLIGRDRDKGASVHDILREAGLGTRSFYRHFASKDDLVLAMYRADSERVATALAAAVAAAPTPLDAVEAWIDENLAIVYEARRMRRVAVLASLEAESAEGYAEVHRQGMAARRIPLVEALREGRNYRVFPRAQPETDAYAIQAVVAEYMGARIDGIDEFTRQEARTNIVDFARRALM
jgi:AcrR family transcriptional regulator